MQLQQLILPILCMEVEFLDLRLCHWMIPKIIEVCPSKHIYYKDMLWINNYINNGVFIELNIKNIEKDGRGRVYIDIDGKSAELLYKIDNKKKIMSIYHTFVPEIFRGRGIAEKLALRAFELAREDKLLIRPDCEYIQNFILKHKELEDMITYEKW